ncbi:MAG: TrkA family potassium uptake protein [Christensenellaceae bacterium]|nr:TrkA family potassium uptake protein [Christensenellaceae bacterium]
MKSFLVIGAGKFGHFVCQGLNAAGCDVMIVDEDESKLSDMLSYVSSAKIGDCTRKSVLMTFGVEDFDAAIVCIPEDFQDSLQTVDLLKELGAQYVVAVASTEVQAKFLRKNGADEIIFPDRDIAKRLAVSISNDSVFDFINLSDEYAIYEISAPKRWLKRSIIEINVQKNYKVNIVVVKSPKGTMAMPDAKYVFNERDHLMVLGRKGDIEKLI